MQFRAWMYSTIWGTHLLKNSPRRTNLALLHHTETTAASSSSTPSGHTHTPHTDPTHHRLLARVLHAFNNMCQWVQLAKDTASFLKCMSRYTHALFIHSTCISSQSSYFLLVVFSTACWLIFSVSVHLVHVCGAYPMAHFFFRNEGCPLLASEIHIMC